MKSLDAWFPQFSPDGRHVASGSVSLVIDGQAIDIGGIPCTGPKWVTDDLLVFASSDRGTYTYQVSTGRVERIGPEFSNYAASGTGDWFAAKDGWIRKNGVAYMPGYWPSVSPTGDLAVLHEPDGRNDNRQLTLNSLPVTTGYIEQPVMLGDVLVWSKFIDGGRSLETWGRVGGVIQKIAPTTNIEFDPRLVQTPEGLWLCVHDHTDFVLVPLGSSVGYRRTVGDNRNLWPVLRYVDGAIDIVACTSRGELVVKSFPLSAPRADVRQSPPPVIVVPPPVVPPPQEPPVTTPDHSEIVRKVARQFTQLLLRNTREDAGQFTERAVLALAAVDPEWGHIRKAPGQTQHNGHAEDAVMYRKTRQAIDILGLAGAGSLRPDHEDFGKPAFVKWDPVDNGGQDWMAPVAVGGGDDGDLGDEDRPKPPATDARLDPAVRAIRAEAVRLQELADLVAAVPAPPQRECPPCPLPHGSGSTHTYADLMALYRDCTDGRGSDLGSEFAAHLIARYVAEGFTREQLIEEARNR